MAKQMNRCAALWCRTRLVKWHLDHIVPLALGGLHDDAKPANTLRSLQPEQACSMPGRMAEASTASCRYLKELRRD